MLGMRTRFAGWVLVPMSHNNKMESCSAPDVYDVHDVYDADDCTGRYI